MKRDILYHLFTPLVILIGLIFPKTATSQVTWDQTIDVASSSFGNNRPRITANAAGDPLIIWGKGSDLMYTRWDGAEFASPIKLNPTGVTIATANWMGPEIAAHGDTIYVVYKQTPEDLVTSHIWCIRSFDGGQTFTAPVQVENTGNDKSRFPTVTTDNEGHPIIAYMRFNASFLDARWVVTRSFDFGETFTSDVMASGWSGPDSEVCDCCPGTIHSSGDNVAIVYRDNNENLRDSWAGISTDGGLTFTKGVNIDQNGWMINACPSTGPDGVIVGDTLYSIFMNAASGQAIVYYNETPITDLSTDTSQAVPGSGEGLQQNFARIASSGKSATMLWRHSAEFSTGLAVMFTEDITKGFPTSFDTLAYFQVVNGDVTMSSTKILVTWQDNSGTVVKFRSGTYETSTATGEISKTKIVTFHPNPAENELYLEADATPYYITNLSGQMVLQGDEKQIDISTLPPGLYFISTASGFGKFVKQ
jgi:type IX secretion system substrate protein